MEQEDFNCSICLDILTDPVTIPCGHNYCMSCINGHWNCEDQKQVYTCPLCKYRFTSRPVINKNPLISCLIEKLKETEQQATGPGDLVWHKNQVGPEICSGAIMKYRKYISRSYLKIIVFQTIFQTLKVAELQYGGTTK